MARQIKWNRYQSVPWKNQEKKTEIIEPWFEPPSVIRVLDTVVPKGDPMPVVGSATKQSGVWVGDEKLQALDHYQQVLEIIEKMDHEGVDSLLDKKSGYRLLRTFGAFEHDPDIDDYYYPEF